MHYNILLDLRENIQEIEAEEQSRFVRAILESLEVPLEIQADELKSIDDKIKFCKQLEKYSINIIDDMDGGLKIYVESEIIAEWKKTQFKLKEDISEINPKKKVYLEMQVDFWSMFEEGENINA